MADNLGYTGKTAEAMAAHDKAVAALVGDYLATHPDASYLGVAMELGLSPTTVSRYTAATQNRQETP